jgi:hypothetical protein
MRAMYGVNEVRGTEAIRQFAEANAGNPRGAEASAFLKRMRSVKEKGYW